MYNFQPFCIDKKPEQTDFVKVINSWVQSNFCNYSQVGLIYTAQEESCITLNQTFPNTQFLYIIQKEEEIKFWFYSILT